MTYQEQQEAIKNKVVGVANDVADRASSVVGEASRQTAAAKHQIASAATDVANRAAGALNDAGVDTESLSRSLGDSFNSIAGAMRKMVRERPLGALAVTAVFGLILGAMSNR